MAIEDIKVRKFGTNDFEITVTDGGRTVNRRVEIPDPLPEGVATKKAFLESQARRIVKMIRNDRAEVTKWAGTATNQTTDATEFLATLQTEFDS